MQRCCEVNGILVANLPMSAGLQQLRTVSNLGKSWLDRNMFPIEEFPQEPRGLLPWCARQVPNFLNCQKGRCQPDLASLRLCNDLAAVLESIFYNISATVDDYFFNKVSNPDAGVPIYNFHLSIPLINSMYSQDSSPPVRPGSRTSSSLGRHSSGGIM